MSRYVSPSVLASDFSKLGEEIERINNSKAGWIHCDVMDGVFVPNISFGVPVIEAISRVARKPLDIHLMIVDPGRYIETFCSLGADILTIHQEASKDLRKDIALIRSLGVKAGVSISPSTPVDVLSGVISELDIVLIMSVFPGFGGQSFIENTYQRVAATKEMILKNNSEALIQVDGGVGPQNARQLFDSGVDILVAGTTVFKSPDPAQTVDELLSV